MEAKGLQAAIFPLMIGLDLKAMKDLCLVGGQFAL